MRNRDESSQPRNFAGARHLLQQRCLDALAHELGNIASPVALVAEVLDSGLTTSPTAAAKTLRLTAQALARATTLCRLLRGSFESGALSPVTISDVKAWWTLCAPYVEEMLPDAAHADGDVPAVTLAMPQYQALLWACISIARYAAITRPSMTRLRVTGVVDDVTGAGFVLQVAAAAARGPSVPRGAGQLLKLATSETRRVGGRMLVSDMPDALDCRVMLPMRPRPPTTTRSATPVANVDSV